MYIFIAFPHLVCKYTTEKEHEKKEKYEEEEEKKITLWHTFPASYYLTFIIRQLG